jgi:hypothetical protein
MLTELESKQISDIVHGTGARPREKSAPSRLGQSSFALGKV